MTAQHDYPIAIIGSGNIGTDLMIKILRSDGPLRAAAMVGIDPASDGLARAKRLGVPTTADGVDGLLAMPNFGDITACLPRARPRSPPDRTAAGRGCRREPRR